MKSPFFRKQPTIEKHSADNNPYSPHISLEIPNYCEFENVPTNFTFLGIFGAEDLYGKDNHFGVTYVCPSCHRYIVIDYQLGGPVGTKVIPYDYDFFDINYPFSETITKLSPRFKQIYQQTSLAESTYLNELTGFGYRKALEFLVKDYLIKTTANDADKIKSSTLNNCIQMLPDEDLQNTSRISAWVGNDSTHYIQKNPDLGLEDLKDYLDVTAQYLDFKVKSINAGIYLDKHRNKKN